MTHTAASLNTQVLNDKIAGAIGIYTVKPVMRGHLNKCPYMTCVPSSQVHFNVKVDFGSQKMQFRHPDRCPLVTGFTVLLIMSICIYM